MDWQQLVYFATVARMEHFTQAANELSLSQPALSRAVARLERDLGVPLFDREGRSIRLNRYGQVFLERVERILHELTEARREIVDLAGPERGLVTLAFLHTLGVQLVPDALAGFRQDHPDVRFQLFQSAGATIRKQLETGEVDLCLMTPYQSERVKWVHLLTEELYLLVPPGHRLAGRGTVELCEVADDPFVCLKPTHSLRQIADDLCREAGFEARVAFEGEEMGAVRGLVMAGLGVALIPAVVGRAADGPLGLHVSIPRCQREIGLGWVEGRYLSAAARSFRDFVIEHNARDAAPPGVIDTPE